MHAVARWFRIFYCTKCLNQRQYVLSKRNIYLGIQLLQNHARNRIRAELVRSEVAQYSCYQWKANGRADLKKQDHQNFRHKTA